MRPTRAFWFGIVPALFLQGIGAYAYFVLLADSPAASPLYGAVKILLVIWPIVWLKLGAPLPRFRLPFDRRSIAYGLTAGLTMAGAIGLSAWFQFDNLVPFGNAFSTKADDLFPLAYFVPVAVVFSLGHSLFEEYFWRWFVFGGLRTRMPDVAAAFIGSLGFTIHHIVILSQFFPAPLTLLTSAGVCVGGLIWCHAYRATASLSAGWISHALVDAAIFGVGYAVIFAK